MKYVAPTVVDYGNVAELTATQNNASQADGVLQLGDTLGVQNSTGPCATGFELSGGICVHIPG